MRLDQREMEVEQIAARDFGVIQVYTNLRFQHHDWLESVVPNLNLECQPSLRWTLGTHATIMRCKPAVGEKIHDCRVGLSVHVVGTRISFTWRRFRRKSERSV